MKKTIRSVGTILLTIAILISCFSPTYIQAASNTKVAKTQNQLEKLLADKNTKAIQISTSKKITITIPKGDFDKKIVINAPKASVVNKGQFNGITVTNLTKYTEKTKGNTLTVKDNKLTLTIPKSAEIKNVTVSNKKADVKIVADGSVKKITVNAAKSVDIQGDHTKPINVNSNAKGVTIKANSSANVTMNKDGNLVINTEQVKVIAGKDSVVTKITNNTNTTITIVDKNDTVLGEVKPDMELEITNDGKNNKDDNTDNNKNDNTNNGSVSGGGSSNVGGASIGNGNTNNSSSNNNGGNNNNTNTDEPIVDDKPDDIKIAYTIVDSNTEIPEWDNLTPNTKLLTSDTQKYVKFQIKDSNGVDITSTCGYTVESSYNYRILVSGNVANGVIIVPVNAGTAYLNLKDGSKIVDRLPITIVGKSKLASFMLNSSGILIATDAAIGTHGATCINYYARNQYAKTIPYTDYTVETECISRPLNSTSDTDPIIDMSVNGKIKISTNNAKEGTYTYRVVAKMDDVTQIRTFTIYVNNPYIGANEDYTLQFINGVGNINGADRYFATFNPDMSLFDDSRAISVNIAKQQSNVIVGGLDLRTVTVSAISVIGKDGITYAKSGSVSCAAITNDELTKALNSKDPYGRLFNISLIDINTTSDGKTIFVNKLPIGSYTVTVELDEFINGKITKHTVSGTFTINDLFDIGIEADVLSTTTNKTNLADVIEDKSMVNFMCDGVGQIVDYSSNVKFISANKIINGKDCIVKNVTIAVPIGDDKYVQRTVDINCVFTTTGDGWK